MMRFLGYDVGNEDVIDEMHSVCHTRPAIDIHDVDVFRCLREYNDESLVSSAAHSSSEKQEHSAFSVMEWGKRIADDYKQSIAHPGWFSKARHRRAERHATVAEGGKNVITSPKHPDNISTPYNTHISCMTKKCGKSSGHERSLRNLEMSLPTQILLSATILKTAGEEEDAIPFVSLAQDKTKSHYKFQCDSQDNDQQSHTFHSSTKRLPVRPHTATGSRNDVTFRPVTRRPISARNHRCVDNISVSSETSQDEGTHHLNRPHAVTYMYEKHDAHGHHKATSSLNQSKNLSSTCAEGGATRRTLMHNACNFLLSNISNPAESFYTAKDSQQDSLHGSCMATKIVKSVKQLEVANRHKCELSGIDIDKLERKLQVIAGVCDGSKGRLTEDNSQRRSCECILHKGSDMHAMRCTDKCKISHNDADQYINLSPFSFVGPLDDVVVSDEEDDDDGDHDDDNRDDDGDAVPRWKRDLMREAPPGLAQRSSSRAVTVINNVKKQKELTALVSRHTSQTQTINAREHARKIRARMHLYFTMMKLDEAVARIKHQSTEV